VAARKGVQSRRTRDRFGALMSTDPERLRHLRDVRLFSELGDEELGHLAAIVRESSCRAGQIVVRQGESAGDLFSVIRGRLKVVSVNDEGQETMLSVMNAGDVFGEIALFDQEPRSATVVAAEPCQLLVLPRAAFRALLCQMPACVRGALTQVDRARLQTTIARRAARDGRRTTGRRRHPRARLATRKRGPGNENPKRF
jgi:CRP-like cAMP-binding protein